MSTPIFYLPSPVEAERQAMMPKCSVTRHVVMIAGSIAHSEDAGPCPQCGGVHQIVDEYDDPDGVHKALALAQDSQQTFVRGTDGKTGFYVANGKPGDRTKIVSDYRNRMKS